MLSKSSSVSRWSGLAQVVVEVREDVRVGLEASQVAQVQPLAGEVAAQGARALVLEHAPDLLFEHGRILQLAGRRDRQQLIVGNAAPDEERQPRRELEIADAIGSRRGATLSGSCSTRKRNRG